MRYSTILSLALFACPLLTANPPAQKLTLSCGSNGIERQMCEEGALAWSQRSGVQVEIFSTPSDSNERLALYQQLLGARSKDIDIYQIDVVWPGILAPHLLDLGPFFSEKERRAYLTEAIRNNTVGGKLVAIAWFADGGLLYYRKDLLEKYGLKVPETWEELGTTAEKVLAQERAAGNRGLYGFVFQGRAYEGLTCNALEWISSYGGGTLVGEDGRISVVNPQAIKGLELIQSWMGKLVPKGVLTYGEEEARGAFQAGKAIFMRNWPYAWALLNAEGSLVKGKVGMSALPKGQGGKPSATLGGWGLAVSRYSTHARQAVELVRYLTGEEQQRKRSLEASFNPTLVSLYDDPALLQKNPHLKALKAVFLSAVPRPSRQTKAKYNRVSTEFWGTVHAILSGTQGVAQGLQQFEKRMASYSNGGKW